MVNLTNTVIHLYIISTLSAFAYVSYDTLKHTDNYFAACLLIVDNKFTKLLLYNVIVSLATLIYKLTIAIFYVEVKENQTLNMIQKLGYKIFELCYFLYVIGIGFGFQTFMALTIIFMMFIFHSIAIARANYLIHTHVTENMNMNYRLLAHFIILLFLDFQMVSHTFFWLFGSESGDSSYILFAYYCITISMSILEPAVGFFLHFYQVYTNTQFENSDINMVRLKFIINVPRLLIQLFLSGLIAYRFTLSFLMIFTLIQSINQISKTFKNYNSMKKLIDKMKNLKQLGPVDLQKQHDRICTVCFSEIATSALLLPCKHIFHKQCLRQWIIKNSNHHCPKCKKSFDFQNMKTGVEKQQQFRKTHEHLIQYVQRNDPLGFGRNQRIQLQNRHAMKGEGISKISKGKDNIQIVKIGQNHVAKVEATKKQIQKQKPLGYNVGSVPFGLPTQAIYHRKSRDIAERARIILINNKMIKLMKLEPVKQLLFVPQFQ